MKLFIVGSGKLANALLAPDGTFQPHEVVAWDSSHQNLNEKGVVIHAGSGRQFHECATYCSRTKSVLIELSTGTTSGIAEFDFPYILCPNTSFLVLRALNMINENGKHFENCEISILESHQSTKKTEAGTAVAFARSLHFPVDKIISIRDPEIQQNQIGIPRECLSQHAYHKIVIRDGDDELTMETKVLGHTSYVHGVKKIVDAVVKNDLACKRYSIFELVKNNVL